MMEQLTPYQQYELLYWKGRGLKLGLVKNKKQLRKYLEKINEARQLPDSSKLAMDVGCGPFGGMSLFYPSKRWLLVDGLNHVYKNMVKRNPDFEYLTCYGEDIPVKDGVVDIVFSTNALDHSNNRLKTEREIYRTLKPGGIFALCVHCRTPEQLNEGHQQAFTPAELVSEIYAVGFTKCDYTVYEEGYTTFAGVIIK